MKSTKNSFAVIEEQLVKLMPKVAPNVVFKFEIAGQMLSLSVTLN